MTIPIDQFLNADDFDLAENITFTPFNPEDLQDFGDIAFSTTEFVQLEALEGLTETSAKADQSDQPFTPSFQPLNEAGVLTAGETLNKSAVGSTMNNSLGVQDSSMRFLSNTSKFGTETDSNLTEESIAQIEEAQKTLSTGTLGLANSLDLAEGGIKFSTTNMSFGATNILMGSEGTFHTAAPIISTVAGVENRQAQTIQQTADIITDNAKNKVVQVEGLNSSIAGNTMTTSLEGQISVSNYSTNTAVQKIVSTSNVVQNIGAELVQNRSKGVIANQADGAISTQGSDISITASAGSMSSIGTGDKSLNPLEGGASFEDAGDGFANVTTTDPTGKTTTFKNVNQAADFEAPPKWQTVGGLEGRDSSSVAPSQANKGGGSVSIIANKDTTMISKNNMVMSAEGNSNQTVGGNLIQNAKGSATMSGNFTNIESKVGTAIQADGYIRQQAGKTGTLIAQGFTFAGFRFGGVKKFIDQAKNIPLKIREIPNLPSLPEGISFQDLEDCIPEKYKNPPQENPEDTDNPDGPDSSNAPTAEEAGRREKQVAAPVGKESGSVNEQDGVSAASDGPKSNRNDPNTLLSTNTSPSDQSDAVGPNKVIGAAGVIKGGSDVFPKDEIEPEDIYNRTQEPLIDPDADEELNGVEFIIQAVDGIIESDVQAVADELSISVGPAWVEVVMEEIDIVKSYIKQKLIGVDVLLSINDQAVIDRLLFNLQTKDIIENLEKEVIQRASIGGVLSFLSSAYSRVKSNIGLVNDIGKAANENNTFNVIRTSVAATAAITDREIFSDIGNIIDSSAALSNLYGQVSSVVTNPKASISDVVDTINFGDIETVISKGLETIGVDNLETAGSIAKILNNIKNSQQYKEDGLSTDVVFEIINSISLETGLTTRDATQLYEDSKDVIGAILQGDVRDALLSSELTSILGFFIGESNAALLGDLQSLYFSGVDAIDDASSLVQSGTQVFNTVQNIYTQLKAVPAFIGLMNSYEMPTLSQAATIFKCFELIKQVNSIIDDVGDISDNIDSLRDFGGDVFNVFDAFSDLTGGLATGGIVSNSNNTNNVPNIRNVTENTGEILSDITNINESNSNTTNTGSNRQGTAEGESIISSPDNETILINNTELTSVSCLTSITDVRIDTNHSDDPNDWKPKRSNLDAVDSIEKLPRMAQILNSIKETNSNNVAIKDFLTDEQVEDLKGTKTVPPTNNCYLAPKLNLLESTIEVIEIKNNVLLYKMTNPDNLKLNNKNVFPTTNTIVQLYIRNFFDIKSGSELVVERSQDFFSPILYNFKTISYHRERNIGLAHLLSQPNRIHLKNTNNVIYNYSITDIGNRLNPVILDSYIIA